MQPVTDKAEAYRMLARELSLDAAAQPVEMLLNPLKATVGLVGGAVETARSGPPRYDMHLQLRKLGDGARVYGFSAFRHQDGGHDSHLRSSMPGHDATTGSRDSRRDSKTLFKKEVQTT